MRVTDTLNENLRNPQSISLDCGEIREACECRAHRRSTQFAEVIDTAEIHGEVRSDRNVIHITTKLEAVAAFNHREVVTDLMTLFHAVDERKRLAAKESETGNVDGHVAATRPAREVVQQPAA